MSEGWKQRHGVWFPASMHDVMCDLTIGKKWRELVARGDRIDCEPWIPYLDAMKVVYGPSFKVSDWTRDHVRHWVMNEWPAYIGPGSCGKAVLLDEPLVFPDHVGTFREVKVGDEVICATGRPAKVVAVHDQTDLDLFRVTFADGTSTVCARGHLWTVRRWGASGSRTENGKRIRSRSLVTSTVSVERMASWCAGSFSRDGVSVPLCAPVHFRRRDVPLDPYVLGCLLGDGSFTSGVTLTSDPRDAELRDAVSSGLRGTGCELRHVADSRFTYSITSGSRRRGCNHVLNTLRKLGLYGLTSERKFIPCEYLINSEEVRFAVLSGLLDTDGTVGKNGAISFCTVSRRLADGVRFLLESVGASVTESVRHQMGGKEAYELRAHGLSAEIASRLFMLTRKRSRIHTPRHCGYKSVVSVARIEDRAAYPRETRCITLAETDDLGRPTNGLYPVGHFTVTHNSNDVGACVVPDLIVDPNDTITLIGTTTRPMLQKRIWEAVLRYLGAFQSWAESNGFVLPVRVADAGYAILNERDGDNAASMATKAGIHGIALDEGGKLQGAHMAYVRVVVDELATIKDLDAVVESLSNLSVAKDFKFAAMANPGPWTEPSSSIFLTPVAGIESVSVDTREWKSTFGMQVLHDDGLKSPCVLHPELAAEYPFLTQQKHLDIQLKIARGNERAPSYWKMTRGFPVPAASDVPPVLDPTVASRQRVCEPAVFDYGRWRGTVAGIDPAWTTNGDGACRARCYLMVDEFGKNYLDFTGGLDYLKINAEITKTRPAVEQLAEQSVALMRRPFEADFEHTAVDSSGNQGLGSVLIMSYGGFGILEVNNSERASEAPMFKWDRRPACDVVADRGTEAWIVLARFCEAGMVRGLPEAARRALCVRHLAVEKDKKTGDVYQKRGKDRLEEKKEFKKRFDGRSPDEADACALAALAVKEKYGVMPYGFMDEPVRSGGPETQASHGAVKLTVRTARPRVGASSADPDSAGYSGAALDSAM